jgi:plasmid stability protein
MAKINLPDEVLALLKADAQSHGLKIEERAEQILLKELAPGARRASLFEEAQRISAMTPKGIKQTDSTILIREERDR